MDLLENLNEKQREAVLATEGYVRVIAGAGSGKTKLLVSRYAYLVQEYGIDPANVLCVTFTNKAAGEMRQRIRALIGPHCDTSLIATYHGFCARLLREDAGRLFLSRDFQIIDAAAQKTILGEIYRAHDLKLDYASFEKILRNVGRYKTMNAAEYVPAMCSPSPGRIRSVILTPDDAVVEEYMQRQKAVNALDFHDLLSFALYLLETNEKVRTKWQEKLNYIQVDEFQDSSARELRLIDLLSGMYRNLMIVGDPDQNIYEWRGSDVRLLVDFDQTHTDTQTILLNRNYRSTPQILRCANELIDKNELRLKKDLFTLRQDGERVIHYHSKSDEAEARTIAGIVKENVANGRFRWSDHAVLYRSGFLSRVVEKGLVEANVPYEIYGGVRFFERMEVLDVIAYLRLLAFRDDDAFRRIVNVPRRRFGRSRLAALEALRSEEGGSLLDVLAAHLDDAPFADTSARAFVEWLGSLSAGIGSMRITEIVNRVTTGSGYEEYIRSLGDEERYENLMEFKRVADEFERSFGEDLTLPEFLQQIALQAGEDSGPERDAVRLMTIHAAKGLEFPVVFVIGFSEGIFPSSKTIEERKQFGLEEERRLCYVAITRARERLFLMDSEGTSQNGMQKLPSRFLREIGEANYLRIGEIPEVLDREARAYSRRLNEAMTAPALAESPGIGSEVTHHAFGRGTVVRVDPRKGTVTVSFDKLEKPRTLSASYFLTDHALPGAQKPALNAPAEPLPPPEIIGTPDMTEDAFNSAGEQQLPEEADAVILPVPPAIPAPSASPPPKAKKQRKPKKPPAAEEQVGLFPEPAEPPPEASPEMPEEPSPVPPPPAEQGANLWKDPSVPKDGWVCAGITDLGEPSGVCGMCGEQTIRYVHRMIHPAYRSLGVGCVCAGKMEGDLPAARKRERDCKNREARRASFMKRPWKRSRSGNPYLKIKEHLIVLYHREGDPGWKFALDSVFSPAYPTREEALGAAFAALDKLTNP